jgi:uncharacterized protein YggE
VRAVALTAAALVTVTLLALPAAAATPDARTITVVGTGEAEPESDPGEWTLVVSNEHVKARTALRATNAALTRVQRALRAGGVAEFQTGALSLSARSSGDQVSSLRGFVASRQIEFSLPDAQRAATVLDRAHAVGARQIYGASPTEEAIAELQRRALADGLDDATEKARRLAAKAGLVLGPILTIDERRNESPYGPGFYPGGAQERFLAPSAEAYATVTVTFAVS